MLIFFHLLTNDYFQCDFLNKLYIWSTLNNISLPFHEVRFKEDQPWTTLLNHEQLFDVNQKLLASPLKNRFSSSSVFFSPIDKFHSTSNNQRISCFHKRNCTCFYFFYHMCFIQRWLIWLFFKGEQFDWFAWILYSTDQLLYN